MEVRRNCDYCMSSRVECVVVVVQEERKPDSTDDGSRCCCERKHVVVVVVADAVLAETPTMILLNKEL